MKHKLSSLFVALLATTALRANVITGQCGSNLNWSYDTQTKTLSITGYGDMWDYWQDDIPWGTVSTEITSISLPNGLTSIGAHAFDYCEKITEIQIPQSVTKMGQSVFSSCRALTSIDIPASVTTIPYGAFTNCWNLRTINIPEGVQEIGDYVFAGCQNLLSITLPSTITNIGSDALRGIKEIYCLATTPPTINSNSIDADAVVYVPCSKVSDYLAVQYWQFLNVFGEMDYKLSLGVSENGSAKLTQSVCSVNIAIVEATPSAGLLFDKWSDGNTDNPRTISLTKDTVLTPLFKKSSKQYTINLLGIGYAEIEGYGYSYQSSICQTVAEGTYVYFYAISDCGRFEGWSDGVTTGDRGIRVTSDTTISAVYSGIETYHVSITAGEHGRLNQEVVGEVSSCASSFNFEVTADEGYHFVGWSDGETRGWREIDVYSDTTIQALFAKGEFGGKCGDNLYWSYDVTPSALTITGEGEMISHWEEESGTWRNYNYEEDSRYYWLPNIKTISLPDGLINIDYLAFKDCRHLQNITIPASVVEIEESAFEDCRSMQSVTFAGTNLTSIGDWAFYNCHELQNITIPEGVQEIGQAAFFNCVYLDELTLPSSMKRVGDNGFAQCKKLRRIVSYAVNPPEIDAKTFEDVDRNIPVIVPSESVELYENHIYWKEFFIQGGASGLNRFTDLPIHRFTKIIKDNRLHILHNGKIFNALGGEVR